MSNFSVEKNSKTAFNELVVAELTPVVALQFPYNINSELIESRENNGGTVTQANGMAVLSSGTNAQAAAHMLSRTTVKYGPGQGVAVRFSAIFTQGVVDSVQLAGIGEVGDGLFFGFNGSGFSILRRETGVPEIQTMTITSGNATGTGNVTINLDGEAKLVAITSGDTPREMAVKIANADYSDTGLGWSSFVNNSTIIFKAWSDGILGGLFSLVDTDTTGAAGTFAETIAGASTTLNWIAQADWSFDQFNGSGGSGITLDPTKGNVYQIQYQWLGFGQISFFIENPDTGKLTMVHSIKYANANIIPSLQNPTLPLHIMSKNTGNTSDMIIKTGSMAGFIEGKNIVTAGIHQATENNVTSISTTEVPILSIKNKVIYQGVVNRVRTQVGFLSVSADSTSNQSTIVRVRKNGTLLGPVAFADHDTDVSAIAEDIAATGITVISSTFSPFTAIFTAGGSELIDFHLIDGILAPGDVFTITAEMVSGSDGNVTASIVWVDLF